MEKAHIRQAMRERGPADIARVELVVAGLFGWMSIQLPGTAAAFLAMPSEVDLSDLFDRLPGWRWVLPRVEDDGALTFRDRNAPLERHPFGMYQPADSGPVVPVAEIDLILAPGVAFDPAGGRLGNGGGFYDRVLVSKRGDTAAVGVTFEDRVLEEVPMEDHDQRVDHLATELGVRRCWPTT